METENETFPPLKSKNGIMKHFKTKFVLNFYSGMLEYAEGTFILDPTSQFS
jgi:hypothetical protein